MNEGCVGVRSCFSFLLLIWLVSLLVLLFLFFFLHLASRATLFGELRRSYTRWPIVERELGWVVAKVLGARGLSSFDKVEGEWVKTAYHDRDYGIILAD
jgi:hypothetical protein